MAYLCRPYYNTVNGSNHLSHITLVFRQNVFIVNVLNRYYTPIIGFSPIWVRAVNFDIMWFVQCTELLTVHVYVKPIIIYNVHGE